MVEEDTERRPARSVGPPAVARRSVRRRGTLEQRDDPAKCLLLLPVQLSVGQRPCLGSQQAVGVGTVGSLGIVRIRHQVTSSSAELDQTPPGDLTRSGSIRCWASNGPGSTTEIDLVSSAAAGTCVPSTSTTLPLVNPSPAMTTGTPAPPAA